MKKERVILMGLILLSTSTLYAQNPISEGTITYNIVIKSKDNQTKNTGGINGATNTIYFKGMLTRTDMSSSLGNETIIHNAKTGEAVILKEYSGQKLMISLTRENWVAKNKKYDAVSFVTTSETKNIEGYKCKKAVGKLNDGSAIVVYYAADLIVMNKDFNQAFKNLPGLPLEYELETEKLIFKYTISKFDFTVVPATKFDFPKTGYRVMTYDENQQGKKQI